MGNYNTKYFGEIVIDETNDETLFHKEIKVKYNGQEICIGFSGFIIYDDKLKVCMDILDKYIEVNEISNKAIIKRLSSEKLKELNYPNIDFYIGNDEISVFLEYITEAFKENAKRFNKAYVEARQKGIFIDFPPCPLRVRMDAKLNVLDIINDD